MTPVKTGIPVTILEHQALYSDKSILQLTESITAIHYEAKYDGEERRDSLGLKSGQTKASGLPKKRQ